AACGGGDDGPGPAASDPGTAPGNQNPPTSPGAGLPGSGSPDDPPSGDPDQEPGSGSGDPVVENSPPRIEGIPQPVVLHDTPYVFEPEATDDDGDILHFSITNAPPWATFETATGRLEGTPTAGDIGTYPD